MKYLYWKIDEGSVSLRRSAILNQLTLQFHKYYADVNIVIGGCLFLIQLKILLIVKCSRVSH